MPPLGVAAAPPVGDGGPEAAGEELAAAPPPSALRVLLGRDDPSGAGATVEVLRASGVTSLTLGVSAAWLRSAGWAGTKTRVVFGDSKLRELSAVIDALQPQASREEYVRLLLRLSDLQYVRVRTAADEVLLPLHGQQRVGDLKRLVLGADGLNEDRLLPGTASAALDESGDQRELRLVHRGRQLPDDALLADAGIAHNTVVHLLVRRDSKVSVRSATGSAEPMLEVDVTLPDSNDVGARRLEGGAAGPAEGNAETAPVGVQSRRRASLAQRVQEPGAPRLSLELSTSAETTPAVLARSMEDVSLGLALGKLPRLARGGTGGTYFFEGPDNTAAVFKPNDEEPLAPNNPRAGGASLPCSWPPTSDLARAAQAAPQEGMRRGTRVGEGAVREVAAYLLDHGGLAGVPPTALACVLDGERADGAPPSSPLKRGSMQVFVNASGEADDMGPGAFPVAEVHKVSVLDLRLANTDRNGSNLLVVQPQEPGSSLQLVPIDHAYCLPHSFSDIYFEWMFWPQARVPYDSGLRDYIAALDAEADLAMLRDNNVNLQPECQTVFRVCTLVLKMGAARGLTPGDLAGIVCRGTFNRMSVIEKLSARARDVARAPARVRNGGSKPRGEALAMLPEEEHRYLNELKVLLADYLDGFAGDLEPQ